MTQTQTKGIGAFAKFYVALANPIGQFVVYLDDDRITTAEWAGLALAFYIAFEVFVVPNQEQRVSRG